MTVDDNSSIYVGGLPYDIGEEGLRRVFYEYGAVVAVKIINDRTIGGKCYGFVTFANRRSALQAIKEMDGRTIDGRVIKVNEVKTRGGRTNFNHESSRHDMERSSDGDRGRDRGRDDNYDRQRHQEGHRGRSEDQDRIRSHDRTRDRHVDDVEHEHGRKRERDWERDRDRNVEQQRSNSHHKSGVNRSRFDDYGSRELSIESFSGDMDQGENKLAVSNQKLEELRNEISQLEELVADKEDVVSKLQEKYQNLEDSLISAKKSTSRRHTQLTKLHKCYLQMRDYDERFKKSEQELKWLVDSTMVELGNDGGVGGDGIVTNGRG
ncbi:hypothetical protein ABFS83_11G047000 [Erythranthe nasuta]